MDEGRIFQPEPFPVWESLGTAVGPEMVVDEILTAAGLNWNVAKLPLYTDVGPVDGNYAIVREGTRRIFGFVSEIYTPAQNADVIKFFSDITRSCGVKIDHVGHERGGEKIWATAKLPFKVTVGDHDDVDSYLVLRTSHSGYYAISIGLTTIRVMCANMLALAFSTAELTWSFRHLREFDVDAQAEAAKIFEAAEKRMRQFEEEARRLADKSLTPGQAHKLIISWVGNPGEDEQPARVGKMLDLHARQGGGTAWGLLNAVTEFIDHHNTAGQQTMSPRMLRSAMSGKGADLKRRVLKDLLEWPIAA